MSVDISISVAFGFTIDPGVMEEYRFSLPDGEDLGDEEALEELLKNQESRLLSYGMGGSMYDSGENNRSWICIKRLTDSYDVRDIPGGITALEDADPTDEEILALFSMARKLGQMPTMPQRFLSVLWH